MKKMFFLMMAMIVGLTSCSEKFEYAIEIESEQISGKVFCSAVSAFSQENIDTLKTNLVKIVEENPSAKELKRLVKQEVRSMGGGSTRCFYFNIQNSSISWRYYKRELSDLGRSILILLFSAGVIAGMIYWIERG